MCKISGTLQGVYTDIGLSSDFKKLYYKIDGGLYLYSSSNTYGEHCLGWSTIVFNKRFYLNNLLDLLPFNV